MKKRLVVLIVALIFLLCGCCTCDAQMEQLNQRITELESQLAAIEITEATEPANELATEPAPEVATEPATEPVTEPEPEVATEPVTNATTEPTSDENSDMSKFLDALLASNDYADWLSVATCKEATLDHLLRCAKKCVSIEYDGDMAYKIAYGLVEHPNATGDVIEILCNSRYYRVLILLATADCNDASSLATIAKKCVSIYYDGDSAYKIAYGLVNHPNATGDVIKILCDSRYYRVWLLLSTADCNDASSLAAIAKKCASIENDGDMAYKIAAGLVKAQTFNAEVAMELSNSKYTRVKELAHQALESLENN